MARVLLINSNRFRHPWPVIPFGLLCVATNLEKSGFHNVHFLDLCFSTDCRSDITRAIRSFIPDVIGISIRNIDDTGGYSVHFLLEDVKNDVIDNCKKEFNGPIVIGGPSVGISGREMLDYFDLEYAIKGDGEAVMADFVSRVSGKQPLEDLQGLIIRREKTIILDNEPMRVEDLDSLPFTKILPYIDPNNYRRFGSPVHVQTKRGCAFRCSYCTYNKIEGKKYRLRNPKLVADEIELLVRETGISHVEFTDSIFNVPLSHTKEVLREVIRKNLNLRLHTMGLSPSSIDEELISLMKEAGFNEADVGADSACDPILKNLGKDFTFSDVKNAARLFRKAKMPVTWFIMLGAPADTIETVKESLDTVAEIASRWDLVFVSTGIRIYNGAPVSHGHSDKNNFLYPVKIEPEKVSLDQIHRITKDYSFRYPNFYFYEKENIIPGWLLITGNFLLKIFRSRQPVWRLLIFLRYAGKFLGITFIRKSIYNLSKKSTAGKDQGFSLFRNYSYR